MSRRGKDINQGNKDEEGLWALVTADIAPLKGRKPQAARKADAAGPAPKARAKTEMRPAPAPRMPAPRPAPKGRELDRRTEQKLARGQMDIDAVIDLHGHGRAAAYDSLLRFLEEAYRRGYRCVLAITGKGKNNAGVLRGHLPEWTQEPPLRDIVLRVVQARQEDGGFGAFYILMRRRR